MWNETHLSELVGADFSGGGGPEVGRSSAWLHLLPHILPPHRGHDHALRLLLLLHGGCKQGEGRGHGGRLAGACAAAAVAVQPVVRRLGLDERGVRKVGDLPPHCGVVDVHEQVIVVDVHGQLEALDKLVVPD